MIRDWKTYVKENIDMDKGLHGRGYIANDDIDGFVAHGIHLLEIILRECNLETYTDMKILDVGCANGRLPIGMDYLDYKPERYVGVDVMFQPIHFCKKAFVNQDNYQFHHLQVKNNRYASNQPGDLASVKLPRDNYDLVVCNSLFTHLGILDNAKTYLKVITEAVSNKNCVYFTTWFKSPPNRVNYGSKRTVYHEADIRRIIKETGLEIEYEYGGSSTSNKNQWHLVLKKYK